ncbi:hypothetical protein F2P56_008802 [Juglans regia]|uniref:Transcription factor MYB41-like n=2 Tax=Juglans regia TaxID=51240 RepID=A0A2I4E8I3_JUGRE|nr:transcription factor MYB41-like [Juglans regia]KAF5472055.1 hypothetical protein F2P56_008802 [Juglans regia]
MGRAPCSEKNSLKKGPWTPEEDQKLLDYIQKHGYGNWRTLPKNAGLERCGKSCRLRWTNYLRPDIKRGRFSFEEEETIIQLHGILGNKWSAIAARLPGRTDNEIKNYWNTHIRKRLLRMGIDPITHSPRLNLLELSSILSSSLCSSSQIHIMSSRFLDVQSLVNHDPDLLRLAKSLMSSSPETPNLVLQNLHENQLCSSQKQNQIAQIVQRNHELQEPVQEIPPCNKFSFQSDQAQVGLEPKVDLFTSSFTDFSSSNSQPTEWQSNGMPADFTEDYVPLPSYYHGSDHHQTMMDPSSESSTFHSNNSNQNFSFTPSSSPTPLNSNSTYIINSSTEDESCREISHCTNMLKFEIPDILDMLINS